MARERDKGATEREVEESWWEIWPSMLTAEMEAFARFHVQTKILVKARGLLILEAQWPLADHQAMRLRIGFSPLHPFMPPTVDAPDETLERHQHPLAKNLCLLTQESGQWDSDQLVAEFIEERLKQLLEALKARRDGRAADAAALEEQLADPLMPYYSLASEPDSVVLFDGSMALPGDRAGLLTLMLSARASMRNPNAVEAVLHEVSTFGGRTLSGFRLPTNPEQIRIPGQWVRLDPPASRDPLVLLAAAEAEIASKAAMQPAAARALAQVKASNYYVTGLIFGEEHEYARGKTGTGWLFLLTRQDFTPGANGRKSTVLVQGERAQQADLFSRLPVAAMLRSKKVLLVGCGAIGSFVATELARAGVGELCLIDFDTVEPGNSLRWPLGRQVWGMKKATALGGFLLANYPWTRTSAYDLRVGWPTADPSDLPLNFKQVPHGPLYLLKLISSADLVIDATASTEAQHALAFHCRRINVPYILGYATPGIAGGVVARFPANSPSCWVCLKENWGDKVIPEIPQDPKAVVLPVGCSAPTFTGASFDLQEVSLELARTAVGLLSDGAYDAGSWQVAIVTLQLDGKRVPPLWCTHESPPHRKCCGAGK